MEEIKKVCGVVTTNFRVQLNKSCGLHVHVGNSNHGFYLSVMGKLMAMMYVFESTLPKATKLEVCSIGKGKLSF